MERVKKPKAYRLFLHYNKYGQCMSVHFRGVCHLAKDLQCNVPLETHYRKSQPRLVLRGFASSLVIKDNKAIIT